jgi:2-octaprenyl-6-methoxyphenol hydroxylase
MPKGNAPAECEVAIVGGGMVGASLALALAGSGRSVVLIEAQPIASASHASFDERTTALGNGARQIYQTLDVWPALAGEAAPIRHIHISDAGRFGFARLDAEQHELDAFGYTVSNRHLGNVLWRELQARGGVELWREAEVTAASLAAEAATITVRTAQGERNLTARLLVAADGADSIVKRVAGIASEASSYQQTALVSTVRSDCSSQDIAYERFTDSGPIALLPRRDRAHALIWTLPPALATALSGCSESEFCQRLQQRFGWRAGRFLQVGRRASYPLELIRARSSAGVRAVLIGNAAQALHPFAAQGFNLGLRDAAVLAELIVAASDPGCAALLGEFDRRRAVDRRGIIAFTDRLVRLFADPRVPIGAARDLGLLLFDVTLPAKRALSRISWGFGAMPRLARGLKLAPAAAPRRP